MAKRKRLSPTVLSAAPEGMAAPETKSAFPTAHKMAPIANVAGDAATQAALSEVVDTLERARREGRMVLELDPAQIDAAYLVRDRTRIDDEEMEALRTSLAERGQQTPIEVADLGGGRYGLISGWRRLSALRDLGDRPVLALLRRPQDAPDAYLAMIEENEIRVGLSYYERARIVARAVDQSVFETEKEALQTLFKSASRAKRSKIKSFLGVVRQLDGVLCYPEDLGERLGLVLSKALDEDSGLQQRLKERLGQAEAGDAAAEQALLQKLLKPADTAPAPETKAPPTTTQDLAPGIRAETRGDGSVVISGPAFTPDLARALQKWLHHKVTHRI